MPELPPLETLAQTSPDPVTAVDVKMPQVGEELDRLDMHLSDLEAVVTALEHRLQPVILHTPNNPNETPGSSDDASPRAPVAEDIANKAHRVSALRRRVQYLLSALEV